MNFFKNHPLAIEAFFESSIVLTFAVQKEQIESMIPACLELDTFQDKWAFIAVAMVQTRHLRPKGFPQFMGNDFFLIGYRIFVRYKNTIGKKLRGLYILKSETNKKKMEFLGNIFTHYNYTTTDISVNIHNNIKTICSQNSKFELIIEQSEAPVNIPYDSPFADWKEARKFAGPLPHTFSFNKQNGIVLIIKGVRQKWSPEPIQIKSYLIDFINELKLENVLLASAFEIKNIPYYWEKGKMEKWN